MSITEIIVIVVLSWIALGIAWQVHRHRNPR